MNNKDYNEKYEMDLGAPRLRSWITGAIKRVRDADGGQETKNTGSKVLPLIPVTGKHGGNHKYFDNKTREEF